MLAVIKTGGKQYLVSPGQKIKIEKLVPSHFKKRAKPTEKEVQEITFDEVLLLEKNRKVEIGTPIVKATVEAKVLSQTKGDKIIVFKYKKRKNYRRKQGHRQKLTEVEIAKI